MTNMNLVIFFISYLSMGQIIKTLKKLSDMNAFASYIILSETIRTTFYSANRPQKAFFSYQRFRKDQRLVTSKICLKLCPGFIGTRPAERGAEDCESTEDPAG